MLGSEGIGYAELLRYTKPILIRAENIHFYDRNSSPAGIITADKVMLAKTSLNKGNLIG